MTDEKRDVRAKIRTYKDKDTGEDKNVYATVFQLELNGVVSYLLISHTRKKKTMELLGLVNTEVKS